MVDCASLVQSTRVDARHARRCLTFDNVDDNARSKRLISLSFVRFTCCKVLVSSNRSCDKEGVSSFYCFFLSEVFRNLILKAESGERAVKALSLLLQRLIEVLLDEHDAAMVSRKRG